MKRILISNDDGIHANGMACLTSALRSFADVTVVAPDGPRSGSSSAITSQYPLRLVCMHEEEHFHYYRTQGTPADCVKLALNVLFKDKAPDLIVAGINHGRNDGICVLYSGTVGAALEGCIAGIPSLALSLNDHSEEADLTHATGIGVQIVQWMLEHSIPRHTMLSVNIPQGKPQGLKVCRQAVGRFVEEYRPSLNGRGHEVFWMTGHQVKTIEDNETDFDWLEQGYATLTPLQIDLTDYTTLNALLSCSW